MDLEWKLKKTEHIIQDQWIDFRRETYKLPNGNEFGPFYNYSRRNYVVIIARTNKNEYLCVKQFRHGIKEITTEFCAGGIETNGNEYDTKNIEYALDAAKRELLEETGYISNSWKHLITVPSNATVADNYAYIYFADNCIKKSNQNLDDTEFLEVATYKKEEIDKLIQNNKFQQAIHIMAWLLLNK
jgi:ADP-ribose pyrophosphatase